jgi:hypothetical protein
VGPENASPAEAKSADMNHLPFNPDAFSATTGLLDAR